MQELFKFVVLGLGPTAIYVLAAQGIVLVYRGSGVLNFSHGAIALVSAHLFVETYTKRSWPLTAAILFAVGASALIGLLIQLLVMTPLRHASPFTRVIATVGLLATFQQAVIIRIGNERVLPSLFLPSGAWKIGSVTINHDRLLLLAISIAVTVALSITYRTTRFGLATSAVAENQRAVSTLGMSPSAIAAVNWTIGCALAGLAGVLIVPITGIAPTAMTLLIVPAFAAALIGGFRSFELTLLGAIAIGVGQSMLTRYVSQPGWSDALPFLVIVVMLALRGNAIPRRNEIIERLPRVGRRPLKAVPLAVASTAAAFLLMVGPKTWTSMLTTTLLGAVIGLSVVVLTGFAGQVSFAQYTLAGVGALVAGRLSEAFGWPTLIVWAVGIAAAVLMGLVFALPSLRTRGVSLAIITLGLSLAIEKVVFANRTFTGGYSGTVVESPNLLGWDISPLSNPRRFAVVTLVAFVLAAFVVSNIRSGPIGRALLAIRSNERAAGALGIDVRRTKFFAFGVAAAIAALAGVLLGFRFQTIQYGQFSVLNSLALVMYVLLAGVGYILGAVLAAMLAPGALVAYATNQFGDVERWIILAGGLGVVLNLVLYPDGLARYYATVATTVRRRFRRSETSTAAGEEAASVERVRPAVLEISNLGVTYGTVQALSNVSVTLNPGCVTGLIGANGAGKTTLIDAVSGFTPATGEILLDGQSIASLSPHQRARAGLGRTFQSVELFADLTVREGLLTATDQRSGRRWLRALFVPRRSRLSSDAHVIVEALGLEPYLDLAPDELPYGVRRLQGVAQALAGRPSVLLLDEPAAGLDESETKELEDVIRRLADEWGIAVLLVEHHVGLVLGVSDRVVAIDFGQMIFEGTATDAATSPAIRKAYLGEHVDEREPAEVVPV